MSAERSSRLPDRSALHRLGFGRVWVQDVGPAPAHEHPGVPVLWLHDLGACGHTWSEVVPELGRARRCLAPDLPGTGNSDRPAPELVHGYAPSWMATTLERLLDRLELDVVDVVGHGLGGTLAVLLPHGRVRRLVLVAPICFSIEPPFGLPLRVPGLGPLVLPGRLRKFEYRRWMQRQYSTPELMSKVRFDVYWDRISRDGGIEALQAMVGHVTEVGDLADAYRRVRAPTLFVWGDRDRVLPVDDAERSAALVEGARLLVIDGCGHSPQEERPRELARLVSAHLDA